MGNTFPSSPCLGYDNRGNHDITGLLWMFPPHQNASGRMTKRGKQIPTVVSGATSVGKVIFCHHWASSGVPLPSKHIWEDEQVWEIFSHADFWCHRRGKSKFLPSLGFLRCFPPIKTYWEDDQAWEINSPS